MISTKRICGSFMDVSVMISTQKSFSCLFTLRKDKKLILKHYILLKLRKTWVTLSKKNLKNADLYFNSGMVF